MDSSSPNGPSSFYNLAEIWSSPIGNNNGHSNRNSAGDDSNAVLGIPSPSSMENSRDPLVEESTVTGRSGRHGGGGERKRRDAVAAPEDESSNEMHTSCVGKRPKVVGFRNGNEVSKAEAEATSHNDNKPPEQSTLLLEEPKLDYIHVRARRGQATDSHSLAERARREKISERMKILQDLVPGCNKVVGKSSVLDEIIKYIQSLQNQVEFLSMKLEAVTSRVGLSMEGYLAKDIGLQAFDSDTADMAFASHEPREYGQGSPTEWLHIHVGSGYEEHNAGYLNRLAMRASTQILPQNNMFPSS